MNSMRRIGFHGVFFKPEIGRTYTITFLPTEILHVPGYFSLKTTPFEVKQNENNCSMCKLLQAKEKQNGKE